MILDKIPGEYLAYEDNSDISLENILKHTERGIIFVPAHVQVVIRLQNSWITYEFTNRNITIIVGKLEMIEESLFTNIDSPSKRKIIACKKLTNTDRDIFIR
ncbi:MAG: hypothetical protein OXC48_04285 [Endozoicomonadaceae bacterium]|nr:hypothetical protein [Endozoicomonadaceae bacterium]